MSTPALGARATSQDGNLENSSINLTGQAGSVPLRSRIEAEAREARLPLADVTVLDKKVDPYRQDTPAGHRDGAWLAEQMARLGIVKPIHLRGLHYALVSSTSLTKPHGERYLNNADDWAWLQVEASKAARWLGYVPFDRIVDERNSPPVIVVHRNGAPEAEVGLGATIEVTVPDLEDIKPTVYLDNFKARQKYRLVVFGEKTSLAEVVRPLCERYRADLYLPSGEITDSQLYLMAKTGAEDRRPMIVFILADFDPAGNQMAVSIGRKLQAFKDLLYPQLEFEVIPIALTEEQVRELDLPSTPLKETEKRADAWRLAHGGTLVKGTILANGKLSADAEVEGGLEQTEIDALATLQPNVLRRIVRGAFDRYFDHDLDERAEEVAEAWQAEAQEVLDEAIDEDLVAALHAEAETKLAGIRDEVERINAQLRASTENLGVSLPPLPDPPEPELPEEGGLPPLISSAWS
ncbi:MAG: hypothetical protein K0R41_1302 [Geminicoccaceae bacterium]|nr:hypothetical protein [Geminicoccaceae bacterium]